MKKIFKLKDERGAVPIVEAAIVFPVVFFVVILFIVFGNFLYQQSRVDAVAVRAANYLARVYSHPIIENGAIPDSTTSFKVKPYRYLVGNDDAVSKANSFIDKNMKEIGQGFFLGMDPKSATKSCSVKNYVVYHVAQVQINYTINLFPLKFFDGISIQKCSVATSTAAVDAAEFMRNIDMIGDLAEEYDIAEKLESVREFISGR